MQWLDRAVRQKRVVKRLFITEFYELGVKLRALGLLPRRYELCPFE